MNRRREILQVRKEPAVEPEGNRVRKRRAGEFGQRFGVEDQNHRSLPLRIQCRGDHDAVVLIGSVGALYHSWLCAVGTALPPLGGCLSLNVDLHETVRAGSVRRLCVGVPVGTTPDGARCGWQL